MSRTLVVAAAALAAAGCASIPAPPEAPLIEYRDGLTILIRNPFECSETTGLACNVGSLEYDCVCRELSGRELERQGATVQAILGSVQ